MYAQFLKSVMHMHQKCVYHYEIKSRNIFIDKNLKLYLTGFDSSVFYNHLK